MLLSHYTILVILVEDHICNIKQAKKSYGIHIFTHNLNIYFITYYMSNISPYDKSLTKTQLTSEITRIVTNCDINKQKERKTEHVLGKMKIQCTNTLNTK